MTNQNTPLKIVDSDAVLPTTPLITKTFIPMGGVIIPISSSLTSTTPNHSRL